jgi:hypothetical protein
MARAGGSQQASEVVGHSCFRSKHGGRLYRAQRAMVANTDGGGLGLRKLALETARGLGIPLPFEYSYKGTMAADTIIAEYRLYLADNRRRSVHSVRAYVKTAERLTGFLAEHLGGMVDRVALSRLSAADLRAFLAHRRGDGLTNRSTARELSAARNFLRFALGEARLGSAAAALRLRPAG